MTKKPTKKKRKKKIRSDNPLRNLEKAMRRLDPEQGAVARRNARSDVLGEIRKLRTFLDNEYPTIKSRSAPRRKRKTGEALFKHLCESGWVPATEASLVEACATAGVQVKRLSWRTEHQVLRTNKKGDTLLDAEGQPRYTTRTRTEKRLLVPDWVGAIWRRRDRSVGMLKKAKKSRIERDAVMVESEVKSINIHTQKQDSDEALGMKKAS